MFEAFDPVSDGASYRVSFKLLCEIHSVWQFCIKIVKEGFYLGQLDGNLMVSVEFALASFRGDVRMGSLGSCNPVDFLETSL